MEKIKRLFGEIEMGWERVVLFAVAAGVYTGLVMLVPFLKDTSFQDIGISYEWWVVFAVIVVTNCKKPMEAALKCFVFFLISQPLVYVVEVLAGSLSVDLAKNYYFNIWLPMSFATLPGGLIAYFCKKQSALGAVVLGLGNAIEMVVGAHYVLTAVSDFPHHLLSALFCFAAAGLMTWAVQDSRRNRIIALAVPAALTAAIIYYALSNGLTL